jgi:hypothetical protein
MTEPLPAPSATGVRTAGDRYQWLVAWQGCLTVLRDAATSAENPALSVGIEVDDAGNLDDVVLYRHRPPHTYQQVKYAVDDRTLVNTEYLTDPSKSGGPSILRKIALSWRRLAKSGEPIELALVTNRAPDAADPLISGRDARTRLLRPGADRGGPASALGQARSTWANAIGMPEAELLELLAVLQFDLARDRAHLEEVAKLAMLVTGLRGDDQALAAGADWVAQEVVAGHRKLDLAAINRAVDERELRAGPALAVVSIATLRPDPLADQANVILDWVDRFDGADAYQKRRPKPPATWQQLQQDIEAVPSRLGVQSRIAVTGSLRLATAFTVGAALRMVTNTDVAVVQRGTLWTSDAPYDTPITPKMVEHEISQGGDLAVAIEVAAPISDDVLDFLRSTHATVSNLIVLSPPGGTRDRSVNGPDDACALAIGIRNTVRRAVSGHPRVHLFIAGPMGLALLLGHRWNRIAPTIVYEDLAAAGYEAAFNVSA